MLNRFMTYLITVTLLPCLSAIALGAPYSFTTIDFPGTDGTLATGINDSGQIVGDFYYTYDNPPGRVHGFLVSKGIFTVIDPPGGLSTGTAGINDSGQIVGTWNDSSGMHGYLYSGGIFTKIDYPGARWTDATGINDSGQIVGTWGDSSNAHGYLYSGGTFTRIDYPGADWTIVNGFNDVGQIVGAYGMGTWPSFPMHGYLYSGGTYTTIDFPGSSSTRAIGINGTGDIVGWTGTGSFLYGGGAFTTVDIGVTGANVWDINNAGRIVGVYNDSLFGREHGFIATPLSVGQTPCVDTDGNGNVDNDGDGLCDNWETTGVDVDGDGTMDLQLYDVNGNGIVEASERADPNHKDIYIESDWMELHQPDNTALNAVIDSFARAPVANPDGTQGIRLHLQTNEQAVLHNDNMTFPPRCTGPAQPGILPDFDEVKSTHFGTSAERTNSNSSKILGAKRLVFHYSLFIHNLLGGGLTGCAEVPGNDFVVSLGGWTYVVGHNGSLDQQATTFMHEFGHNLGLYHGGLLDDPRSNTSFNCKPNYLSVMNYTFMYNGAWLSGRPLDYSRIALPTLHEGWLDESNGIFCYGFPCYSGVRTAFGPTPVRTNVDASGPINWDRSGGSIDTGVSANINNLGFTGCTGTGSDLEGYDDWSNLLYNFRTGSDYADAVHQTPPEEMKFEEVLPASPDDDGDGVPNLIDNCTFIYNPDQIDTNQNAIGNACEVRISGGAYNFPETTTYRASFSMDVIGPSSPSSGWLKYYYSRTRMNFVSTVITVVSISGKTATISGSGTVNGTSGHTFTATVADGAPDSFGITILKPNGSLHYSAGSKSVSGGDLAISQQ